MSNQKTKVIEQLGLPTLSSFSKQVLTTIMVVFPLALIVDPLISPFIAGLPSLAIAMTFVLIMSPIMTILMPLANNFLDKFPLNKTQENSIPSNENDINFVRND